MSGTRMNNVNWRIVSAIFAAFTLLACTVTSTRNAAFAESESSTTLKALPKQSFVDDGSSQLLQLKFKLNEATVFKFVRITIDGTQVLEFDASGNPIGTLSPPFEFVFGHITMLTDGYYAIGKAKGKFVIAMDKLSLGIGEHEAKAEVVLGGGAEPLVATDTFKLKSSEPPLPDLVAKYFVAPSTIMKNVKYWTFTIETNEGEGNAKQHDVNVYLSNDNALDSGDRLLGQHSMSYLAAGDFNLVPITIKVPKTENEGNHFLFIKVDAQEKIKELSEGNNVLSKAAKIVPNNSQGQHNENNIEAQKHDHQDD